MPMLFNALIYLVAFPGDSQISQILTSDAHFPATSCCKADLTPVSLAISPLNYCLFVVTFLSLSCFLALLRVAGGISS